jgi:hypothetical protein
MKNENGVQGRFPSEIKLGKEASHSYTEAELPRASVDVMV